MKIDEQVLKSIVEASLNEIFVFGGESLGFIFVNQGARENIGYSIEKLSQMTPVDIKPEFDEDSFQSVVATLRDGREERKLFNTKHQRKEELRIAKEEAEF